MADTYISNITGMLDVEALVKNLTTAKQKQIQKLNQDKALAQAKSSSINNFLSGIRELNSFLQKLKIDDLFKEKKASVSDPSIVSVKVSEKTPNVNFKLKAIGLAQGELRVTSAGVNNLSETLSSATFSIKYWTSANSFQETIINFNGGTLQDLVNTINQSQSKIEASIYFDGTSYKLLLAEKDVGASSKETDQLNSSYVIEMSSGTLPYQLGDLSVTLQEAKNARIKIGQDSSTEITSATNTFKDVISGLEITLQKTSNEFVQINIDDNYERANSSLNELFNRINGILNLSKELTNKGALFQGNFTLTQVKRQLFNLTNALQKLGLVEINESGQYSLNTTNLNNLIRNNNIDDIKEALSITQLQLSNYLEGISKTLQSYVSNQDKQIKTLDKRLETLARTLVKEEEKLRLTFTKIESLMYENSQLRNRLENFMVSLNENKK